MQGESTRLVLALSVPVSFHRLPGEAELVSCTGCVPDGWKEARSSPLLLAGCRSYCVPGRHESQAERVQLPPALLQRREHFFSI